jgi:hypothetical protein
LDDARIRLEVERADKGILFMLVNSMRKTQKTEIKGSREQNR